MKQVQRKTERRISAALRLVLVALLLLLQIAIVVALTQVLRQKAYIAYAVLEIVAVFCVARIYIRPGSSSYKPGWIILIMLVPVVGLILYFLWNGNQVKKKLALKTMRMPPELPEVQESSDRAQAELARRWPRWAKLTEYLRRQDLPLFANTEMTYFPTGEEYLEDLLARLEKAQKFIFLEYYIASKGQIWDRICKVLAERAADGVEVNLILDDFGSMMTMPPEEIQALRQKGIWVQMFNPVHHYVNRLYFNYRDHRKIAVIDGDVAYTGGATAALAASGAEVVHVDAAKGMVAWAKDNLAASGLAGAPVRFIVDDAMKFVLREQRRGRTYHGILMDPPSYGRGPNGEMWKIEDNLYPLVEECVKLLDGEARFFLINSYTTGLAPSVLSNVLKCSLGKRGGKIESDEVGLPITRGGMVLPCGASGRWEI